MAAVAGLLSRGGQQLPQHEADEGAGGEEQGVAAVDEGEEGHGDGDAEAVGLAAHLHPVGVARLGGVGQLEAAHHADDARRHGQRAEAVGQGPEDEEDERQAAREGVDHGLPHGVLLVGHHDEARHQEDGGDEEELLVLAGPRRSADQPLPEVRLQHELEGAHRKGEQPQADVRPVDRKAALLVPLVRRRRHQHVALLDHEEVHDGHQSSGHHGE